MIRGEKNMKKRLPIVLILVFCLVFTLAACGGGSKGGSAITSPADFPGHNIALQTDTTAAFSIDDMIENGAKDITVSRYEKVTLCFDDLSLDRVDAVYVDSVVSAYYTAGSDKYNRVWINDVGEPMGLCFAKSSAPLEAAVEAALDTMFFDGSMAEIAIKNFGDDFTAGLRDVKEAPVIPTDFTTLKEGKLLVGAEVGYPPMEYMTDDGTEFIGFDIDVSKRLGELLGLEVEIINTNWDGIFAGLEKGQYDLIASSVSITEERQERYILTEPYVSNALCIVVKSGK
jgi:ABC-type amino acid transport substrate-binding protein